MSPVAIVYFCSKTTDSLLGRHHHLDVPIKITNTVSAFIILWRKNFYVLCSHKIKKNKRYLRTCSTMHGWKQYCVFLHVTLLTSNFDLLYLLNITTLELGIYPEHFFPSFHMDLSILLKILHAFLVFPVSQSH